MLFPCLEHSSCPPPFFFPWWLFLILQKCLFLWQISQTPGLVRPSAWQGPGCPSTYHLVLHLQTPILHGTWHAGRSQRQVPSELNKRCHLKWLCGSTGGHAEDWEMPKNTSRVSFSPGNILVAPPAGSTQGQVQSHTQFCSGIGNRPINHQASGSWISEFVSFLELLTSLNVSTKHWPSFCWPCTVFLSLLSQCVSSSCPFLGSILVQIFFWFLCGNSCPLRCFLNQFFVEGSREGRPKASQSFNG